ncbi:hypothetical protein FG386_003157 [Cryptosporidium ryanae]|uniref:uncharacterized protein n=1 Tax=Cryptosporidium ryanae TaxID=515981 RepID=UPI00351A39FC|nr:hypothetical protein FG386_003157 [Cryptosporidium ryanae]
MHNKNRSVDYGCKLSLLKCKSIDNNNKEKSLNLYGNEKQDNLLENRTSCICLKNTDVIIDFLEIEDYIDMDKRTCNRIECKNKIELGSENKLFFSRGWSRYPIKLNIFETEISKNWNISFHGTTHEAIKSIVRDRRLVIPNNITVHIRQGHIPDQFFIFTSPSLIYASFGLYSAPFKLESSEKWWQIVVELTQKPGTYIKEWETSGLGMYKFDENIGNDELEWKSDKEMSNFVKAVLIREIENIEPPICLYPIGTYFLHDKNWWYQPYDGNTPFKPDEINSICSCLLQRGARKTGSMCPVDFSNRIKKCQGKFICRFIQSITNVN